MANFMLMTSCHQYDYGKLYYDCDQMPLLPWHTLLSLWPNSIRQRLFYFIAVTVYKCLLNNAPSCHCNFFTLQRFLSTYQTRSATDLKVRVTRCHLNFGMQRLHYRVTEAWNCLPLDKNCAK